MKPAEKSAPPVPEASPKSDPRSTAAPSGRAPNPEGYTATTPSAVPRRGWSQVFVRVVARIGNDNLGVLAAGIAFFALLSLAPALAALVSVYGLVADPSDIAEQIGTLQGMLPPASLQLIDSQLHRITETSTNTLTLGVLLSLLLSIWSANRSTKALFAALNVVFREEESRPFLRHVALSLLFTGGTVAAATLAFGLVSALPSVLRFFGAESITQVVAGIVRWPALAAGLMFYLALLYAKGPHRRAPTLRWSSPGALVATIGWLAISALLSAYIANFGRYDETYGSMGAVAITMLWLYISALVILVGATVNSELEYQTAHDTTIGPDRLMGLRGAYVADHVISEPHENGA